MGKFGKYNTLREYAIAKNSTNRPTGSGSFGGYDTLREYSAASEDDKLLLDGGRYMGKDISSFLTDSSSFLSDSASKYEKTGFANAGDNYSDYLSKLKELSGAEEKVKAYQRRYGDLLDKDQSDYLTAYLKDFDDMKDDLSARFSDLSSLASKVGSEDEFNRAIWSTKHDYDTVEEVDAAIENLKENSRSTMRPYSSDEVKWLENYGVNHGYSTSAEYDKEIGRVNEELKTIQDEADKMYEEKGWNSGNPDPAAEAEYTASISGPREELENTKGLLETRRNQKKEEEEFWEEYKPVTEAEDFEEGSRYVDPETLNRDGNGGSWDPDNVSYKEDYYAFADKDNQHKDADIYEYINSDEEKQTALWEADKANQTAKYRNEIPYDEATSKYRTYRYMTEEEKSVYNYLYNTQGKESAYEFLSKLSPILDRRYVQDEAAKAAEFGYEHWIKGSIRSLGTNLQDAFLAPAKLISSAVGKDDYLLDETSAKTQGYREGAGEKVGENLDAFPLINKEAGKLVYSTLMSVADNAIALGLGSGVGVAAGSARAANIVTQVIMSSSAASQEVYSAHERGISGLEAAARGFAAGAIEWLTEHFSIEALLADPKRALGFWAKNLFTEGTEEAASSVLNMFIDELASNIAGHPSEIKERIYELMESGMSYKEAARQAIGIIRHPLLPTRTQQN